MKLIGFKKAIFTAGPIAMAIITLILSMAQRNSMRLPAVRLRTIH